MRSDRLEQLFVKRRAGLVELMLVLESETGARQRRTVSTPSANDAAAMRYLARCLAQDGAKLHPRLRVRRESGEALEDAPQLKDALLAAFGSETKR